MLTLHLLWRLCMLVIDRWLKDFCRSTDLEIAILWWCTKLRSCLMNETRYSQFILLLECYLLCKLQASVTLNNAPYIHQQLSWTWLDNFPTTRLTSTEVQKLISLSTLNTPTRFLACAGYKIIGLIFIYRKSLPWEIAQASCVGIVFCLEDNSSFCHLD